MDLDRRRRTHRGSRQVLQFITMEVEIGGPSSCAFARHSDLLTLLQPYNNSHKLAITYFRRVSTKGWEVLVKPFQSN